MPNPCEAIKVINTTLVGTIDKTTHVRYQKEYGAGRSDPYRKEGFYYFDVNGGGADGNGIFPGGGKRTGIQCTGYGRRALPQSHHRFYQAAGAPIGGGKVETKLFWDTN